MKGSARIGMLGMACVMVPGCIDLEHEDAPGAWALGAPGAQASEWVTVTPSSLEHVDGRGTSVLRAHDQVTLLHGAYAQRIRVDVASVSAMWLDWARFGACARTLTFEIDEVRTMGDDASSEAVELDDGAFEVVTRDVGGTSFLVTGRMVASVADAVDDGTNARGGRGRGRGIDEETSALCAETFGEGAELDLMYTLDVNVVEADRAVLTPRSQCAAPGEGVRMLEGGEEVFQVRLEDAQRANVSGASNWSKQAGMWTSVTPGSGPSAGAEEPGDMSATLSVSRAPGELAAGARDTDDRFDVEVVPEEQVGAFDLQFWYRPRGFSPVDHGGWFWTYGEPDTPALWITMSRLDDVAGDALCGDGLSLEFTSRTPEVCDVRDHELVGFEEARPLEKAVFFAQSGECTLEVRAPRTNGGDGLTRTYTFTLN